MGRPATRFVRDRHGMILVVAIPMAALLVCGLSYLASVGDAILYRERLQDAADAAAFESALLHARGMNALAMLNVLMSLLGAVSAMIRAVQMLGVVSLVFLGGGDALLTAASETDARVGERIARAGSIAADVQAGLAGSAPVLAALAASADTTSFYREARGAAGTLALSHALLPTQHDAVLGADPERAWLFAANPQPRAPRLGARLAPEGAPRARGLASLPAERDRSAGLCEHASQLGGMHTLALSEPITGHRTLARQARAIAARLPRALEEPLAELFCRTDHAAACRAGARAAASSPSAGQDARCQELLQRLPTPELGAPARIWREAENGNVMLQTWGIALGEPDPRELLAPTSRPLGTGTPREPVRVDRAAHSAFAQAEYYFACPAEGGAWAHCGEDAAWALGWTARMRRFFRPDAHLPSPELLSRAFDAAVRPLERQLAARGGGPAARRFIEQFFAGRPDAGFIH